MSEVIHRLRQNMQKVAVGICPRCGGKLDARRTCIKCCFDARPLAEFRCGKELMGYHHEWN